MASPPTAGFINSLDPANPTGTDFVYESDDWHRFKQQVILNQFPTSEDGSANGWDAVCSAKASQVSALDDLDTTESVETRLSTLEAESAKFPGGGVTYLAFWQASAPSGWTQETETETPGIDNCMLRVVETAGGGLGGSNSPINMSAAEVPEHTHGFDTPSGGNHNHGVYQNVTGGGANRIFFQYNVVSNSAGQTELYTDNVTNWFIINQQGAHTHPSGTTDANSGSTSWEPKYVDMIIASKD